MQTHTPLPEAPFMVGAAKTDITFFRKGLGMHGYGRPHHRMKDVATPIYARAVAFRQGSSHLVFVNVELGMCSIYLKNGVVQQLQQQYPQYRLTDSQIMITAQHTHSAGGGFGQHFFYNIPSPGFQEEVYQRYRDGIVQAIVLAEVNMQPATLHYSTGLFDEDEEVAFNRSLEAYNQNPEVKAKLKDNEWHLAADREMKLMEFRNLAGQPIAHINWFGTHCTSISNDKYKVCSDNKGYAAQYLEDYYRKERNSEVVCLFAQDACGDITPNFVYDTQKRWTRGKYKDDFKSAQYTGNLQSNKAIQIIQTLATEGKTPGGNMQSIQAYVEFSAIECDPAYTNNQKNCRTSQPSLGVTFLEGTVEGPGLPKTIGTIMKKALDIHKRNELNWAANSDDANYRQRIQLKYETQDPKHVVVEAQKGKFAWLYDNEQIPLPSFLEKTIHYIQDVIKQGKTTHKPWIISRLPLQIFFMGPFAIVGIPTEITTIAAQRLKKGLLDLLQDEGIQTIILSPYANAYAGYVTTSEEYMLQSYEGGHTLYGKWTLAAMQTAFKDMIQQWKTGSLSPSEPFIFPKEHIWVYGK